MNYRNRRSLLTAFFILVTLPVLAQIPRTISYQGMVEKNGQALSGEHVIRITFYDSPTGGTVLFEEAHQATLDRGVFSILLGSQVDFPASLRFDKQYYLGISLDGDPELIPRTALVSAPYALNAGRAALADGLTVDARGVVTSINELSGSVRIIGDSTTLITQTNNEIRVHARPTAGGIRSLTSPDATIDISNSTGPASGIGIADNAITSSKLRDGAVTLSKLAQGGATAGQIIKWNGSRWVVADDGGTTYTAGQGIAITNNTISATGGLPAGTLINSTLRWNGTLWTENVNLLSDANGNTQTRGTSTLGDGAGADNIILKPGSGLVQIEGFGPGVVKSNATGVLSSGLVDLSTEITGILPVNRGGTGVNTIPVGAFIIGNGTNPVTTTTLTAGSGITLTPGTGTMTIATSGWSLLGNAGTIAGTNFLGTTDNQDLVIKTNNAEALRVTTAGRVGIGTATPSQKLELTNGNLLLSNTSAAGELRLAGPNRTAYSALKSGAQTTDITYTLPITQPTANQVLSATTVAGTGPYTVALGWMNAGTSNDWTLTGNSGTSAGTNFIGTTDNQPFQIHVFNSDAASKGSQRVMRFEPNATSANIIGGYSGNNAVSNVIGATIAGGGAGVAAVNSVTGNFGTISGGSGHLASLGSTVGGGYNNRHFGTYGTISGGETNAIISGTNSTIAGGRTNNITGSYSTVAGGYGLTINADNSFGFLGGGNGATITASNVAFFGNVDLWLGGTDGMAHSLLFYESQSTSGVFPATGVNFSSFKAGAQTANILYTLPTAEPTANQVLSATSITGTGPYNVSLSWADAGSGNAWNLTGNGGTTAGTNFLGTTDNQRMFIQVRNAGTTNNSLILNNNWSLQRDDGGNARGANAVDLQKVRFATSRVASGDNATITGGEDNTASGNYSTVSGKANAATGVYSTISGGTQNTSGGSAAVISGGYNNMTPANRAFIGGGENNFVDGQYSVIVGGSSDTITGDHAFIGGGYNNDAEGEFSVIGGGVNNRASAERSVIIGGSENRTTGLWAVAGGDRNVASNIYAMALGGSTDSATGHTSVVLGGVGNTAAGYQATIVGGSYLRLGDDSYGFNAAHATSSYAANLTASAASYTNVVYFGNADLWLGNTGSYGSRQLRFYQNNSGTTFPTSVYYSAFQAPSSHTNNSIIYTLPAAQPTANQVLSATAVSGSGPYNVTLGWANGGGTAWNLTGNSGTTVGTNFLGTTDNQDFVIKTNNTEAVRVTSGGKVGIGTNSPQKILHVVDASGQNPVFIENNNNSSALPNFQAALTLINRTTDITAPTELALKHHNSSGSPFTGASIDMYPTSLTPGSELGSLVFATRENGSTTGVTEKVRITATGLVGIGTSTPAQKLDVFNGNVLLSNSSTAGELRFAGPNVANYSAFKAGGQSVDITYTLPTSQPTANQVLAATTVSGSGPYNVTLGWANASSTAWNLTGNSGTTAGTNFLGTTDNQPMEIKVDNNRAMRYQPGSTPSIIGGHSTNVVASGTAGATIAGGGSSGNINRIDNNFGTIGGGWGNIIHQSGSSATIGGGAENDIRTLFGGIASGFQNIVTGDYSTIGGGEGNWIDNQYGVIAGGHNNTIDAPTGSRRYSAIPGGAGLLLAGSRSFGYHANNAAATINMQINDSVVAVFGNTDLWLANNDNAASKLKFFEAYSQTPPGLVTFPPTGTNFSSFEAGAQSADILYTLPGSQPTANQVLSATSVTGSGPYNVTLGWANSGGTAWTLTGNSGTTAGTNFLGTTDNQAFEIKVNNARALRIVPGTSPNMIGGYSANTITTGKVGSTIGGGGATGNAENSINGDFSTIAGGAVNVITGDYASIGGGSTNSASAQNAVVGGGSLNIASGEKAGVGAGFENHATAIFAYVGGGWGNEAIAESSTIGGGRSNDAGATYSTVGGGSNNVVSTSAGDYSTIAGGGANSISGQYSTIAGGAGNTVTLNHSAIAGGLGNSISGQYAAIAGGRAMTLSGNRSFGFNANNASATLPMTISASDVAAFGNADLWLANNDNNASQLRFYEPNNQAGGGAFPPANINYTSFQAGAQTADVSYTLPAASPVATGNLLLATSGASSAMSWSTGMVWDNTNARLGINTTSPSHSIHSISTSSTDEVAAVYGHANNTSTSQAIGVWGDASNTGSANTGTIGVLATGSGNTTAGETNVALQINDGSITVGRTTEAPSSGATVNAATAGTAYTAQGPSGVIELTLGAAGDLGTAAPTVSAIQDLGVITINNRYCVAGSIVLVNVSNFTDDGNAPDVHDAAFIVNVDNTAVGSFDIRVKMIPSVTSASNYSVNDKVRVGYIIVNPSK